MAKVILLNGPVAAGKTTIAKRYIDEHPMTLGVSSDDVIAMIGGWLEHEEAARILTFGMVKAMIEAYLISGQDVIIPYMVTDARHAEAFEQVALAAGAEFHEVALIIGQDVSIERVLARGTWGEPNSPPVTEEDKPVVIENNNLMLSELAKRPSATQVASLPNDIDGSYQAFLAAIGEIQTPSPTALI